MTTKRYGRHTLHYVTPMEFISQPKPVDTKICGKYQPVGSYSIRGNWLRVFDPEHRYLTQFKIYPPTHIRIRRPL